MREIRFRNSQDASMYNKGYEQGRADEREKDINERADLLAFICKKYSIPLIDMNCTVEEWEELRG